MCCLSNFILHYLYMISYHVKARIHLLLFMEILGISFLMLLGGLKSLYMVFLNPLLIISYHMEFYQKNMYLAANFIGFMRYRVLC